MRKRRAHFLALRLRRDAKKPGFTLQFFTAPGRQKDFRFNPLRNPAGLLPTT
jgi:hypothetical protein